MERTQVELYLRHAVEWCYLKWGKAFSQLISKFRTQWRVGEGVWG